MIEIKVQINRHNTLADLRLTRIEPVNRIPNRNEKCKYEIRYEDIFVGYLHYPFGNGISLSIEALSWYQKHESNIKLKIKEHKLTQILEKYKDIE